MAGRRRAPGGGGGADPASPLERFRRSMIVDLEGGLDGEGYDLAALAALAGDDRDAVEAELVARATRDWRDVQALAALGTPAAVAALRRAVRCGDAAVELAVVRHARGVVGASACSRALVSAIERAELGDGLDAALDVAAEYHPPAVLRALQRALLAREGEAAVLVAGLLFHLHGKADEPFDWEQRPFFLRFGTEVASERRAAYDELCTVLGIRPAPRR